MMKVKKNKKLLAIVLTAALSLGAMAGCGKSPVNSESSSQDGPQNSTESSQSATEKQEEVTINFWHHYSEQSAENETLNNVLIPEFEKENPNIKVIGTSSVGKTVVVGGVGLAIAGLVLEKTVLIAGGALVAIVGGAILLSNKDK